MSVRKRVWFTSIQIRTRAVELAQEAGQIGWLQYQAAAKATLVEALRFFQDKKAEGRAAAAAALTLKKYPPQEAWIVDYATNEGRHIKTFAKKKEADEFAATARVELRRGIHTPSSKSITVAEAGKLWLASAEKNKLERTTVDGYMQHLALHIEPVLGNVKLSDLSPDGAGARG